MGVFLRVFQNLRKNIFRTAPRDHFCNFYVLKVQHLIHCIPFTKLRYFSIILQISVNLIFLESYYQIYLLKILQNSENAEMSVLEFLSNNVAGLQAVNLIKKGLQHMCFR